jgi:hypothetical protein
MKTLELTNGGQVIIDDEDFDVLSCIAWSWVKPKKNYDKSYVRGTVDGSQIFIHRFILKAPKGFVVDHRDGNPLNNRRSNLRIATYQQNLFNSCVRSDSKLGIKGVTRSGKRFAAIIKYCGEVIRLGSFETADEAKAAYDAKAKEIFGEFALVASRSAGNVPTAMARCE